MTNGQDEPRTIYLLHFDAPVGRALHYIGITRTDRLEARLQEHCGEHASSLTARAAQAGTGFQLARTWTEASFDQERRLKTSGHYEKHCPICRGHLDLDRTRKRYTPRTTSKHPVDWQPYGPEYSSTIRPRP